MKEKFLALKNTKDKLLQINILLWLIFIIIFSILGIFIGYVALFLFIFFIIVLSSVSIYIDYTLKKDFKKNIMPKIVEDFCSDWTYSYSIDGFINSSDFYQTGFIDKITGNTFKGEDLIHGKFLDMKFKSCDINCYYMQSTGKTAILITLFCGRFYQIGLPFSIEGHFVIREEKTFIKKKAFDMNKIEFESIEFNNLFDVYTTDDLVSFKYLKPDTFERLEQLEKSFVGKLFLSVENDILSVGFYDNKNNFELKKSYEAILAQLLAEKEILEKIINIIK